ncbi:TERF1-interacting nuclear factor 2, partial [Pezoporus occidentalis]|uniref:TERF1-interacting nuclear factor 2 n=1 Tax=Pezoporus occidentalis TaxID=407982 RepID=UPI002F90B492
MSDVRCALAGAWLSVRARRVTHFPRVLRLLAALEAAAPSALRYRHRARLRLGLQAAVVMEMLREARPEADVTSAVERYFPEGGSGQAGGGEEPWVQEAQSGFRELVLELLQEPGRRRRYLETQAPQDYGARFLGSLEALFHELLLRVESALPRPHLPQ